MHLCEAINGEIEKLLNLSEFLKKQRKEIETASSKKLREYSLHFELHSLNIRSISEEIQDLSLNFPGKLTRVLHQDHLRFFDKNYFEVRDGWCVKIWPFCMILTNEVLEILTKLKHVEMLFLGSIGLIDAYSLKKLQTLKNLEILRISNVLSLDRATAKEFTEFKNLKILDLSNLLTLKRDAAEHLRSLLTREIPCEIFCTDQILQQIEKS